MCEVPKVQSEGCSIKNTDTTLALRCLAAHKAVCFCLFKKPKQKQRPLWQCLLWLKSAEALLLCLLSKFWKNLHTWILWWRNKVYCLGKEKQKKRGDKRRGQETRGQGKSRLRVTAFTGSEVTNSLHFSSLSFLVPVWKRRKADWTILGKLQVAVIREQVIWVEKRQVTLKLCPGAG